MPRTFQVPSYRRHKQSGQAIVTLPDGFGSRHDVLLGKYGTATSRAKYARFLAEWEASRLPTASTAADLTVNKLVLAFWKHAEQHYRSPACTPTDEIDGIRAALRPLLDLYGHPAARGFALLALKAVGQMMAASVEKRTGRPWRRRSINLHAYRVRSVLEPVQTT